MQKAIIELHYLPSIQYFTKLLRYSVIVLEQEENFQKGTYRNRCILASANGPLLLSIPLDKGKNQQQNIRQVSISYQAPWQKQHWKSIQSAYGRSPFFEYYADEFQPFYQQHYSTLFEWNLQLLEKLIELLQLPVQLEYSSAFSLLPPPDCVDLRNNIQAKSSRQKEDPHFFARPYPQAFLEKSGFLPNLSILDLLFCAGPQAIQILEESIVE